MCNLSFIPLCIAAFCWLITTFTQLQVSVSESLKGIHYLFVLKNSLFKNSIQHGDVVYIKDFYPEYVGKKDLAKRIIGLPGDKIVAGLKDLKVIPQKLASHDTLHLPLLDKTKDEKPLTPLKVHSIPEGYVFVAGDNLRSFDSRYEEFGLVPMDKIWGKAVLCW
jgi:signal peptidase I